MNTYVFTRYAEKVVTGDEVMISENNEFTAVKVINVSSSEMQGEYY